LGWILSRFFVEKAFSADAKVFGDTIITDIKTEFAKKLKAADWMDDDTTEKAVEKVHNIDQKVGYPTKSPDIMDPSALSDYYKSLNISSQSFFQNFEYMSRFAVDSEWSALGKPVNHDQWGMTATTVNAYYNPPGNEIVFPAAILGGDTSSSSSHIYANILVVCFSCYAHLATLILRAYANFAPPPLAEASVRRGSSGVHVLRRIWVRCWSRT
jgi:predicted metalloendopeptidase